MTSGLRTATGLRWALLLLLLSGCYYDHPYGYHHPDSYYPYGSYEHGYGAYPYPERRENDHAGSEASH